MKPVEVCWELAYRPNLHTLRRGIEEMVDFNLTWIYMDENMAMLKNIGEMQRRELGDDQE